tara:strand:- start:1565 stop:2242 length:678 start_codon:yes stop_codon:yes gene_type:complete
MKSEENDAEIQNELQKLGYWNSLYSKENYFGTGPTLLALYAKEIIENNNINNILEIGCGQGRDSIFFANFDYNVTATDISENAIKFVEQIKHEQNLQNLQLFIHDTLLPLDFPNMDFDLVYSNLALQFFNLEQLTHIFSNVKKVMKKNSFFLFSTKKPGDKYFNFGQKLSENSFEYKGITRFFYEKTVIEKLLKEQNFRILNFEDEKHTNSDQTISVWWKILVKL